MDITKTHKFDITATSACIGALIFWSLGPIFITYLGGYLDSWTQNMLRYTVACMLWLPFLIISLNKKQFDKKIWRKALVPAAANLVMQSLWAAAFYYIGPTFMVLLTKTNILWIAGFSLIFFPEERSLTKSKSFWIGLSLSITGVIGVMYYKVNLSETRTIIGIIIALLTAFAWAVYTISVKIAFRDVDSRSGFSVIIIYTVIGLGFAALLFGKIEDCLYIGIQQWIYIVVSAILSIALAHVFYYAAIRRLGATIPALVILSQPFIVLAISYHIFGESLNIYQSLFGTVLIAGSALSIWAQQYLNRSL